MIAKTYHETLRLKAPLGDRAVVGPDGAAIPKETAGALPKTPSAGRLVRHGRRGGPSEKPEAASPVGGTPPPYVRAGHRPRWPVPAQLKESPQAQEPWRSGCRW